ncbi:MAG TPA: DMT family transporter [Streptosporangiaceae bacterium]|nr:DMT family transporter [Streptosporangiaceae bacterium]
MRSNRSTTISGRKAPAFGAPGLSSPGPGAPGLGALGLGALGVLCFSVTFPATTAAEASFSPVEVGVGRSVIGGIVAIAVLLARRQRLLPPAAILGRMLIVAGPVGIGFGLFSALALGYVDSVHGAVLTGLIPAATAGVAVWRAGERPRPAYWAALGFGLAVVIGFAVVQGGGHVSAADLLLLGAVAIAGLGYAEGGAVARDYGGWRVICWAIILALPVTVPVTAVALVADPPRHVTVAAAAGLAYVGVISMVVGFFAWYHAMAVGGVARVGRLQIAQPALTLGWSALLLGEHVSLLSGAAAAAVIGASAVGRNARVDAACGDSAVGQHATPPDTVDALIGAA